MRSVLSTKNTNQSNRMPAFNKNAIAHASASSSEKWGSFIWTAKGNTKKEIPTTKRWDDLCAVRMDLSSLNDQRKETSVLNFIRLFAPKPVYFQGPCIYALLHTPEGIDGYKFSSWSRLPSNRCFLTLENRMLIRSNETEVIFQKMNDMLACSTVATVKYIELPKKEHGEKERNVSLITMSCARKAVIPSKQDRGSILIVINPHHGALFERNSFSAEPRIFNQQPSDAFESISDEASQYNIPTDFDRRSRDISSAAERSSSKVIRINDIH